MGGFTSFSRRISAPYFTFSIKASGKRSICPTQAIKRWYRVRGSSPGVSSA
ncbi:MAG: hypothetical protein NWR99_17395 [Verrucomicrobiales bacterium]|nr:hypothetical protein [Verrucomicrobiales bacterium]